MSDDDFGKFTGPRSDDELHQGSPVPVTFSIDPVDRMPVPVTMDNEDRPPPLAVDTLVCMEDKRSFVIRNSDGSVWMSFAPEHVSQMPDGEYFVPKDRLTYDQITALDSVGGVLRRGAEHVRVARVEPVRPACRHYLRMMTDISADRSRRYLTRSCMVQRSETGEFYSVGDAAIFACSIRSPRHLESERILDDFDALKVQQANERIATGSFDVDAALAQEQGSLGVLGSNPKG